MNGKDLQGLYEAYSQVHQSPEVLSEVNAFVGGTLIGRNKSFEVRGGHGGVQGGVKVSRETGKDADAAAKATTTNAVADLKNKQASADIASRQAATAAAKPTSKPTIKPGAKGAAALGGGLSLSSSEKAAADANRAPKPTMAAKVSEPEAKTRTTVAANLNYSGSSGSRPTAPKPATSATPKPDPTKKPVPTDVKRPVPTDVKKPEPVRTKTEFPDRTKTQFPDRTQTAPGIVRSSYEMDTYNLVLEYLLGEGFASTEQAADKIILNMSESWFESILEEVSLGK